MQLYLSQTDSLHQPRCLAVTTEQSNRWRVLLLPYPQSFMFATLFALLTQVVGIAHHQLS